MATGDLTVKFAERAQQGDSIGTTYGEGGDFNQQLRLTDVEVSADRDNTVRYGLTSSEPQAVLEGNESYTVSTEQDVTAAAGEMLEALYDGFIDSGRIRVEDQLKIDFSDLVWNSFSVSVSEDDDIATVSFEADVVVDTVVKHDA